MSHENFKTALLLFQGKKGCLFLNYIIVFPWSGQNKISVENKPTLLSEVSQSVTGTLYAN